jgi:hypothetical protein
MPYLKCQACRVRLRSLQDAAGLTEACPQCGRPLDSVADLSELIGFASIDRRPDGADDGGSRSSNDRLAAAVADVVARRRAAERRARRWAP